LRISFLPDFRETRQVSADRHVRKAQFETLLFLNLISMFASKLRGSITSLVERVVTMKKPFMSDQYKVILLGESRVGKTSIIHHHINGCALEKSSSTVGCLNVVSYIQVRKRTIALQIWDTAGQEVYRSLVPIYVRGARLAIVVFDVTERKSLIGLGEWMEVIRTALPAGIPVLLVANKIDLVDEVTVTEDETWLFAQANGCDVFKTSARTGEGIDRLFQAAAEFIARSPVPVEVMEYEEAAPGRHRSKTCCARNGT
jgi:small GTP-binding protein